MPTLPQFAPPVRTDSDDFPVPRHLVPVAALLADLEYTPRALDAALAHLGTFGSAECCPAIDPEHRALVEELLPLDPAWDSERWDVVRWELTPGPRG